MIRMLMFLLVIVGLAAGLTFVLGIEGNMEARLGAADGVDTIYTVPTGGLLVLVAIAFVFVSGLTWLVNYLMRLPGKLRNRRAETQRRRGMISLSRGLEAVAAGDPADAQRHARAALRQLDEPGLTRLLTAQAAQLAGDEKTAEASFSAMLEAPETEFLGLRGLYLQAMAAGDRSAAKAYADRAFKLRPNAGWAYESVYQLSVERGAWGEARDALKLASKNGLSVGDVARRQEAVLLTAQANASEAAGDMVSALKDAESALKLAPDFPPAAVLAARLVARKGNSGKAARLLEEAWVAAPHPALVKSYENLSRSKDTEKRAARLMKLAARVPEREESKLLIAEQHILLEEWTDAQAILDALLRHHPNARTFSAMAATMRGLYGEEQARPWLAKAAAAPLEPVPGVEGEFHFTTDGWRRLVHEFGDFGRLAPPPLEDVSTALSGEEILLLTAPPPEPEEEDAATVDEGVSDLKDDVPLDDTKKEDNTKDGAGKPEQGALPKDLSGDEKPDEADAGEEIIVPHQAIITGAAHEKKPS